MSRSDFLIMKVNIIVCLRNSIFNLLHIKCFKELRNNLNYFYKIKMSYDEKLVSKIRK